MHIRLKTLKSPKKGLFFLVLHCAPVAQISHFCHCSILLLQQSNEYLQFLFAFLMVIGNRNNKFVQYEVFLDVVPFPNSVFQFVGKFEAA